MLPLLGHAFRIDVRIPGHQGCDQRLRHSADGESDIFETFVTEICLAYEHAIIVFGERSCAAIAAERDVGRISFVARFQTDAEEPIVKQSAAQTDAQPVTLALPLLPVVFSR